MVYDALRRRIFYTDIKGNKASTPYSTLYEYDNLGRLIKERIPFEEASGTFYYTTKKHYYDENGNIIRTQSTNNMPGQPETYTKTEYEYNGRGFLIKVTTYDGSSPENYTQYYYDEVENKIRMYTGLSIPLTINGLDDGIPVSDTWYA